MSVDLGISTSVRKSYYGLKSTITGEPEPQPTVSDQFNEMCSLSLKQRVIGFGITVAVGMTLSLLSMLFIVSSNFTAFGIMYSLGTLCSLFGTAFLVGPWQQIKNMADTTRIVASVVFLASVGLTLYCAIGVQSVGLTIICVIIQTMALIWYTASYIPFARACIKNTVSGVVAV